MTAVARDESVPLAAADAFAALPGLGARGVVDGHEVIVGREFLFADRGITAPADLADRCRSQEQAGCTTVLAVAQLGLALAPVPMSPSAPQT